MHVPFGTVKPRAVTFISMPTGSPTSSHVPELGDPPSRAHHVPCIMLGIWAEAIEVQTSQDGDGDNVSENEPGHISVTRGGLATAHLPLRA
jgi:hypothetical protein